MSGDGLENQDLPELLIGDQCVAGNCEGCERCQSALALFADETAAKVRVHILILEAELLYLEKKKQEHCFCHWVPFRPDEQTLLWKCTRCKKVISEDSFVDSPADQ